MYQTKRQHLIKLRCDSLFQFHIFVLLGKNYSQIQPTKKIKKRHPSSSHDCIDYYLGVMGENAEGGVAQMRATPRSLHVWPGGQADSPAKAACQ